MSNPSGSHRAATARRRGPAAPPAPYAPPQPPPAPGTGGRAAARRGTSGALHTTPRGARRKRHAVHPPEKLRRLLPQALVVAFLAGGTSAFVASDKTVRLSVDGVPRTLHTFAGDVEELLGDEGVAVGPHDIVAPAPDEAIADGDEVIVRYGRPVVLDIDGEHRQVWTTARTVDGALSQLGVRAEGAYLSASRRSAIGRRGLFLDVRTERTVILVADGRERTIRTNAATVREAVSEAGIVLHGQDSVSAPLDSFPHDGQAVTVTRITSRRQVREQPVPFGTVRRPDPTLFQGTEIVIRPGERGVQRVTYALRTVNGIRQKPEKLRTRVVKRPVDRVVRVGVQPVPRSVEGVEGLNWQALAQCESSGRPDAVDPSGRYGGLYQFDQQTWQSVGGSGRPQDASAAEQTYRAKKLYVLRGPNPWPVCGRKLHQ